VERRHALLEAPGSTNFITTTIVNFLPVFKTEALAKIALDIMRIYIQKYPIQMHGFVIMPNHLHLLLTGENQNSISQFTGKLKEYSAKEIIKWCLQNNKSSWLTVFSTAASESKQGHKYQVWQKRFDNIAITLQKDMLIKLNYIHNNPLQERWGLCDKAEDYCFSSARHYSNGDDVGIPIIKLS
jgi:putative transposase